MLVTWLCILPCLSSDAASVHLSQCYPSFLRSQPVSLRLLLGRGLGILTCWAPLACQAPPQCLHPAAADPGSLCQCQPQPGDQDNLLLPLTAKRWCGLVVFTCWEVKHVPEWGFEVHPWQRCFDYNCLNALLTWRLFCSSQNGFKNPVPWAFLCAGA